MSNSKLKRFSVYSAERKKGISHVLHVDDFKDEEHMNKYIKAMKDKQKEANMQYKIKMKEDKFNDILEDKKELKEELNVNPYLKLEYSKLNNFKLDQNTGNSTVIFGSSKTGKSTLMMYLYEKFYQSDKDFICTLFSINSQLKIYDIDKKLLRCNTFNDRSEKFIKLEKLINTKTKNHYKFLNMFDDIINMKYGSLLNEMILTYRNSNLSTIICLQYPFLLNKGNRANVNNVFIFGSNTNESIVDLINTFLKPYFNRMGIIGIDNQTEFFKRITFNHGFFYIHNASDTISIHRLKNKV